MAKFQRVMSHRHFTYVFKINETAYSLQNVVFLVKDIHTSSLQYTQFFKPDHRPIKAYLHGYDVTRFLTHKSNLTNYSYYFLNYAYTIGFNIKDVRDFFRCATKLSSVKPDLAKISKKGLTKPFQPAQTTPQETPFLTPDNPGLRIYEKQKDQPIQPIKFSPKDLSAFDDTRVFQSALRLAASRIVQFKINETELELKHRLMKQAKLKSNGLLLFREYLLRNDESALSPPNLLRLIDQLSAVFGWYPSGSKKHGDSDLLEYSFTLGHLRRLGITVNQLADRMFVEDWNVVPDRVNTL